MKPSAEMKVAIRRNLLSRASFEQRPSIYRMQFSVAVAFLPDHLRADLAPLPFGMTQHTCVRAEERNDLEEIMAPAVFDPASIEATRRLLLALVAVIVDEAEAVVISVATDQVPIFFNLRVATADLSCLIGTGGQTAESIRHILCAIGMRHSVRYALSIQAEG